jgi:Mg-chelatase subunit ChlI
VTLIQGPPGTGKSTTLLAIVALLMHLPVNAANLVRVTHRG